MSDIFISYAREDRARVASLAEALEGRGWSVWWDPHIPTGMRFDDVIEQALADARCIIVVWSASSIKSGYVRAEAGEGAERGILFPVMIEEVRPPLAFRQFQTAHLIDWSNEPHHPEFAKLVRDITVVLCPPPAPAEITPPTDEVLPSADEVSPSPAEILPSTIDIPSSIAEPSSSRDAISSALAEPSSSTDKVSPSTDEASPLNDQSSAHHADTASVPRPLDSPSSSTAITLAASVAVFILIMYVISIIPVPQGSYRTYFYPTPETPSPTPAPTPADVVEKDELLKNIKVKRVEFFEGACPPKPSDGMFTKRFKGPTSLYNARWYVELEHPKAARRIVFPMYARLSDRNHIQRGLISLDAVIEPEQTFSWQCSRALSEATFGIDEGPWHAGRYRVEFFIARKGAGGKLYETTLEVY